MYNLSVVIPKRIEDVLEGKTKGEKILIRQKISSVVDDIELESDF